MAHPSNRLTPAERAARDAEIVRRYVDGGEELSAIARRFKLTPNGVISVLKRHGVPRRRRVQLPNAIEITPKGWAEIRRYRAACARGAA